MNNIEQSVKSEHKLLVIDPDPNLLSLIQQAFIGTAITVYTTTSSRQGLHLLYTHHPDLLLLNAKMPDLDDYSLLTILREITNTPVILLVEQDDVDEVIHALELGQIDDYLTKPFLLKLLIARVKAAFRRLAPVEIAPSVAYPDTHLQIDEQTQQVSINGSLIHLTTAEHKLLFYLVRQAGRVCSYTELLEHTWGWEYRDSTQYVHVYISRLRHKIEPDPKHPRYLRTVHGIGYQFQKPR